MSPMSKGIYTLRFRTYFGELLSPEGHVHLQTHPQGTRNSLLFVSALKYILNSGFCNFSGDARDQKRKFIKFLFMYSICIRLFLPQAQGTTWKTLNL